MMRVSVAMCTFNGAQYLDEQLESVLAQDRHPDELVVCDDGSTDGSIDILEAFARVAPFEVHIGRNEHRLGVTANYERAIRRCIGDVIALCDQDDIWAPHRLRRLEATFAATPDVSLAFSDAWLIDGSGRRLPLRLWDAIDLGPAQQRRMLRNPFGFLLSQSAVTGCTLAIRASSRDLLLPFPREQSRSDVDVLHDWWIAIATAAAGDASRIALIPEPLVSYRLHRGQRVGIPGIRLRRWLPSGLIRARSVGVRMRTLALRLSAIADVMADIEGRLRSCGSVERADRVRDVQHHLLVRARLASRRRRRLSTVRNELRGGAYDSFGGGKLFAIGDVLRAP